jgi:hypothetical protein
MFEFILFAILGWAEFFPPANKMVLMIIFIVLMILWAVAMVGGFGGYSLPHFGK